ncbi:hypothetical protein E4U16_003133 [Claviceps sp. LM84 group G4]|nr:hypothetical protein E4U16_003133 [Claviceps sp. LM84 group G4]
MGNPASSSLRPLEACKYDLMNFVKTKQDPLDTPLWPSNKWTVLMPGSRLCLCDLGNGVPCLKVAEPAPGAAFPHNK